MRKTTLAVMLCSAILMDSHADEFTKAQICKATIAVEMARPSTSMVTKEAGETPIISYVRSDDQQEFTYRCMFQDNQVIWSTYFSDEQSWGRWRNSASEYGDAITTYQLTGGNLTISNDQLGTHTFSAKDLIP